MFPSDKYEAERERARKMKVVDLDTGETLKGVLWADAATGRYRQILRDENDNPIIQNGLPVTKLFTGNISVT
jgi:hypothetical protein